MVQIPARGDRMVRIRTLEEALEELDSETGDGCASYLVQIRPRRVTDTLAFGSIRQEPAAAAQPRAVDGIYLPSGQLNAGYLRRNAELLFAAGEYGLARNIHNTLLSAGEGSAAAHFGIARCFEREGRDADAVTHFEAAIAFQATLDSYQRLAAALIRLKRDHHAAETLERALRLKDVPAASRPDLHRSSANCWLRAGKVELAETHFRRALELAPSDDSIQAGLASTLLQAGRITDARNHFQAALATNPRNDKALTGLGSCFLEEGDKRRAHDHFARALDVQLRNPTALYQLVRCAYEIRSYATAARILGDYVQSNPVNANLLYSLAGLQYHLGRTDEAKTTASGALRLQPDHAAAAELLRMIERLESVTEDGCRRTPNA